MRSPTYVRTSYFFLASRVPLGFRGKASGNKRFFRDRRDLLLGARHTREASRKAAAVFVQKEGMESLTFVPIASAEHAKSVIIALRSKNRADIKIHPTCPDDDHEACNLTHRVVKTRFRR